VWNAWLWCSVHTYVPTPVQAYGPSAFASVLSGDSDNPEVVWTHAMRTGRLIPQVLGVDIHTVYGVESDTRDGLGTMVLSTLYYTLPTPPTPPTLMSTQTASPAPRRLPGPSLAAVEPGVVWWDCAPSAQGLVHTPPSHYPFTGVGLCAASSVGVPGAGRGDVVPPVLPEEVRTASVGRCVKPPYLMRLAPPSLPPSRPPACVTRRGSQAGSSETTYSCCRYGFGARWTC